MITLPGADTSGFQKLALILEQKLPAHADNVDIFTASSYHFKIPS